MSGLFSSFLSGFGLAWRKEHVIEPEEMYSESEIIEEEEKYPDTIEFGQEEHKEKESDIDIEETKKFYPIFEGLDVPLPDSPPPVTIDDIVDLRDLIYNILSKDRSEEFGCRKMYNKLQSEYNIDIDRPFTRISSIMRDLCRRGEISRRATTRANMLYKFLENEDDNEVLYKMKSHSRDSMEHQETYNFFSKCRTISKIDNTPGTKSLVMGAVQSGKSKFIISYAYQSLLKNISTIILVLPTLANESQLRDGFENQSEYRNHMKSLKLDPIHFPTPLEISTSKLPAVCQRKLKKLLDGTTPGIVVLMCNHARMKKLVKIMNKIPTLKYNLVIDEIDSFHKSKSEREFHEPFNYLMDKANATVGVTATIFDTVLPLESEFVTNKNMYLLDIPNDYKGFKDLIHIELEDPEIKANKISNDCIDNFYKELADQPPYQLDDGSIHPIICLHKVERVNMLQEELLYHFKKQIPSFAIIVYNGPGIQLYYDKLLGTDSFMINGKKRVKNQETFKITGVSVRGILKWLKNNPIVSPPTHIMIISGKMADRGISFVSECYTWHLTHELLIVSKSTVAGSLIQGLRICGRYRDNIPLHLITTTEVYEDCTKANKTQEEIYSKAKDMEKEENMVDCIGSMKFDKDEVLLGGKGRKLAVLKYDKLNAEVVESEENDDPDYKPKSEMLLSIYDRLNSDQKKRYETLMDGYAALHINTWIPLTKLIETCEAARAGGYKLFELKSGQVKSVNDENEFGLIAKKEYNEKSGNYKWFIKYNPEE